MRRAAWLTLGVLLGSIGSLAAPAGLRAQAWTRAQGAGFAALSYRSITANAFMAPDGTKRELPTTFRQHSIGFYGEVGIIDRYLTLSVDGEPFRYAQLDEQGATYGLGDLRVGAFTGVLVAPFHLALGAQLGLPSGDPRPNGPPGDVEAQQVARSLPTGDGEWDVNLRAVAGHSFGNTGNYPLSHWVVGDVGYWVRTRGFFDAITYRAEIGTKIAREVWDRFALILRIAGVQSFAGKNAGAGFIGLGDGVSYTSWSVDLMATIHPQFGIIIGVDGAFRGMSVPAAPAYKMTLFTSFGS